MKTNKESVEMRHSMTKEIVQEENNPEQYSQAKGTELSTNDEGIVK